ncbi:MAG: hypothetical protein AAF799_10240 [Myxococcota bacterium]
MTPYDVHHGLAQDKWSRRAEALAAAVEAHPERFPRRLPKPSPLPTAVRINKPAPRTLTTEQQAQLAPNIQSIPTSTVSFRLRTSAA